MFGMLHCKSNDGSQKEAMFVEKPHGSTNAEKNSACNRCRARKVKCSINNGDTCNRCKRLEKQCNFSRKTYRGGQHIRKANNTTPELEYGGTASLKSNKLAIVSLSPSQNSPKMRDEGRSIHAEFPREYEAVGSEQCISVDELRQSPSDQGGDDLFNLPFLPLPFVFPNSPITPPDWPDSTAVTSLDDFLASTTCSGDEIPPTLPSATHSEDAYFFDINFDPMPMSLQTSTADSAAVSCHHTSGQSSCLAASVFAVEDFEARCICNNRVQLDSILASQKEAIKRCRSMIKCTDCKSKRENLVVLVFMTERIVEACRRIVVLYGSPNLDSTLPFLDYSSSMSPKSPPNDILLHRGHGGSLATSTSSSPKMNHEHTYSVTATSSNRSSTWRGLFVGDYEISSSLEWEYLVRLLILLQLKALLQLLADIKDTGSTILGETQMASLTHTERRIDEFKKELSTK